MAPIEDGYRSGRGVSLIAAIFASVILVGCAAESNGRAAANSQTPSAVRPRLTLTDWRNGQDGMLAIRNGRLVVGRDGCVGIQPDGNPRPYVVRWPAGTRISADGSAVVGGQFGARLVFGKEIGVGGGYGGATLPRYCDARLWAGTFDVQQPL